MLSTTTTVIQWLPPTWRIWTNGGSVTRNESDSPITGDCKPRTSGNCLWSILLAASMRPSLSILPLITRSSSGVVSLTFEVGLSLRHFFPFPFASCDNCLRFILVSGAAVVGAELITTIQSSSMWVGGVVVNNSLDVPVVGLLILPHLVGGVVDSSCGWFSFNMGDSSCGWSSEDSVVRGVVDSGFRLRLVLWQNGWLKLRLVF